MKLRQNCRSRRNIQVDIGAGGFTATGVESGSLSSTAANIAVSGSAVTVDSGGGVSTKVNCLPLLTRVICLICEYVTIIGCE